MFIDQVKNFIHNAPFGVGFLKRELDLSSYPPMQQCCRQISDTLVMAKERHPGKRNNLNALCGRYQIDHAKRTLHGALLDAELLAEIYLAVTRSRKNMLITLESIPQSISEEMMPIAGLGLQIRQASAGELELYRQLFACVNQASNGKSLW